MMEVVALALVAVVIFLKAREMGYLRERARIERGRRLELEDEISRKDDEMNGALEKIHELTADDPDAT